MIEVVPFKVWHAIGFQPQDAQAPTYHAALTGLRAVEDGLSFTVMEDGTPIAFGGAVDVGGERAQLWSFLSNLVTPASFRAIHAAVKRFIAAAPFKRLEAAVDCEFDAGHRWMRALGFEVEARRMRSYLFGRDHTLYALVK